MSGTQLSPRQIAEHQIAAEEAAEREARIQAIEDAEEERRRREEDDARRERERLEAEAAVNRLAGTRGDLEDRAEEQLHRLLETFDTINAVDTEQRRIMHFAGMLRDHRLGINFKGMFQTWAAGRLLGQRDPYGSATTLRERDPLATNPATAEKTERVTKGNVQPAESDHKLSCTGTKGDGSPCSLPPMSGSVFCSQHDPDRAESRSQAARIAGKARHGLLEPLES